MWFCQEQTSTSAKMKKCGMTRETNGHRSTEMSAELMSAEFILVARLQGLQVLGNHLMEECLVCHLGDHFTLCRPSQPFQATTAVVKETPASSIPLVVGQAGREQP